VINGYHDVVEVTLPGVAGAAGWSLLVDTNLEEQPEETKFEVGAVYQTTGRSILLFILQRDPC